MTDGPAYPLPLTPTERLALNRIKSGDVVSAENFAKAVAKGWARRTKPPSLTAAGEKALADDDAARAAMRTARRPRRR
jgi:hypothetical protein